MLKVICDCCGEEADMATFRFEATLDMLVSDFTKDLATPVQKPIKKVFHSCEKCYKKYLEKPLHKKNDNKDSKKGNK